MKGFLKELFSLESAVIIAAIIVGLMIGRVASQKLEDWGVPIAGGAPTPVPLPTKGAA